MAGTGARRTGREGADFSTFGVLPPPLTFFCACFAYVRDVFLRREIQKF